MNDIQKKIVKELNDHYDDLNSIGWYSPSCTPIGLSDLYDDTPEDSVYFTLHRDNVIDCEGSCGERTEYDFYGEEYTYNVCGVEGECDAIWDEEVIVCKDGTINYDGELYNTVSDFLSNVI